MKAQKNLRLLLIFNFLLGFSLYSAILVIYFAKVTGSYALAMSLFSTAMISSAVFEVPTGIFSDMIGRKKTIVYGAVFIMFAAMFYAIGGNYLFLFIGALFEGLSRSFFSGNNNAFLYDILAAENKTEFFDEYLGKMGSSEQLALGISAVMGSIIASFSLKTALWLSVIPFVFLLLISLRLVETKELDKESGNIFSHLKSAFAVFRDNYKLRYLSASSIIGFALGESSFQFRPVFVNSLWPLWAVGLSNTLSFFGASASFYFSGRIIKKFNALKVIILQSLMSKTIEIFSLLFPTLASPALMSLTSLMYGPNQVAKEKLFQAEFTDKQRATLSSLNSLAGSLLFGVVSLTLGVFADLLSPRAGLLILQVFNFIPLIIYFKIFRRKL